MKKWVLLIILIFIAITAYAGKVYFDAMKPLNVAEEKAIAIAKEKTSLETIEDFTLYNGSKTYYVVTGLNHKGEEMIVWIPEENGKIIEKKKKDGITKEEAIEKLYQNKSPDEIISVKPGVENSIPLWEIYYRSNDQFINYYYVDFESGEWLKDIQNL